MHYIPKVALVLLLSRGRRSTGDRLHVQKVVGSNPTASNV